MLAAYYARVSTNRQEQEQTIESQIMAIRDFAKTNQHTIIKEYKDEGWSGTILARPALDELRIDARNKIWDTVIVYDPDRIARKYSYQALVIDELEEQGIKVLFVTTPPAKTDEDRLLYGVKGLFAEYERARIADRFRLGKLRKAREGFVVGTEAPYGYDYVPKQANKQGYLEINQREALVVKMIFSFVGEQGYTVRKVVKKLKELNIAPRRNKDGVWNTTTLVNIFRNETYIGKAHYYKSYAVVPTKPLKNEKYKKIKKTSRKFRPREEWIEIAVPRIISDELFARTRRQLKLNFELCQRNRKNDYLLAGIVYCVCGRRRNGEGPQKGKHLYYRCSDRANSFPLPPNCHERGVNARVADIMVWEKLSSLMTKPELIKKQAERWLNQKADQGKEVKGSRETIETELAKLKKEEDRYLKAYGAELITFEQLQDAVGEIKLKKASMEGQLSQLNEQKQDTEFRLPSEQDINRFTQKAIEYIPKLDFKTKQAITRKLVDKVVAKQKELTVYGYLPLGKEDKYVGFWSEYRHCRTAKCRKVHTF